MSISKFLFKIISNSHSNYIYPPFFLDQKQIERSQLFSLIEWQFVLHQVSTAVFQFPKKKIHKLNS